MSEKNDRPAPELNLTRTFDAPRRLVWEAWSKAEHLSKWFTPAPLTTSACELDFKSGGVFRLTMRFPDGKEHPMDGRFGEIVPQEKITFSGTLEDGNTIVTTVTFSEKSGKTTLTVRQVYSFASDATRGASLGWKATLDQLGEQVRLLAVAA
jgi:uncharacterized protein YndB with AHSA1/START domain